MEILIVAPHFPSPDFYESRSLDPRSYFLLDYAESWVESGHNVTIFHTPPRYPKLIKKISDLIDWLPFIRSNPIKRFIRDEDAISDACYTYHKIKVFRRSVYKIPTFRRYSRVSLTKVIEAFNLECNVSKDSFDVVLLDYLEPSLELLSRMEFSASAKKWCVLHITDISYMQKARTYFFERLKLVDGILYRNNGIKEDMFQASETKLKGVLEGIIPSGISDSVKFATPRTSQVKKFLYVGRLVKEKNIKSLIDAIYSLKEKLLECKFTIVGDGPLRHSLEDYVKSLGISHLVSFVGKLSHDKVFEYMRAHDCLMMVSKETFGMVYVEAMSQGCLVIGAKKYGIDGIVDNNVNGFLVRLGDQAELNEMISRIINLEPEAISKISSAAIKTAKELTNSKLSAKIIDYIVQ